MTTPTTEIPAGAWWLCECGHLPSDHGPACQCRCPGFTRGEMMLACGHAADDDSCDPAYRLKMHCPACYRMVWPSTHETYATGTLATYEHCGVSWEQGFNLKLPSVRVKRAEDDRWVIDCPYCGQEHTHSAETGEAVSHCHRGDYVIRSPKKRGKLPFRKVWDRDDWTCVSCGTHKNLTVDHIIPVSKGGTDDLSNLQTMCGSCNSSKGARV